MRRPLAVLPAVALLVAAATLLALGSTLRRNASTTTRYLPRLEAFAASVQRGERAVAAAKLAGALQMEYAVQREAARRDARLALCAFGAAALAVAGAGVQFLRRREHDATRRSEAAA